MTVRSTWFYNQFKQGFSETYYHNVTNPSLFVNTLPPALLTSMTAFRTVSTLLYAIRAQQIESPFRSFTKLLRGAYQGSVQTDPDATPDVIATTAVLQLVSEDATKRRLFLRGLPDDYVKRDFFGNDIFIGTFKTQVQKMVAAMIAQGFAIRKEVQPPIGGLATAVPTLLQADVTNPFQTKVFYFNTVGFQPLFGGKVVFKRIPTNLLPHFQRMQTVVALDSVAIPAWFMINYALPAGVSVQKSKMTMHNLQYAYEGISEFTFERFSAHKTGRPFGLLAGRSRAVRPSH